MNEEEQNNNLNNEEVVDTSVQAEEQDQETESQEEEQQEQEEQSEEQEQQESQQQEQQEEPQQQQVSRRKAERLEKLLKKMGATPEQISAAQRQNQPQQSPSNDGPIIKEGDYSLEEINQIAKQYADQQRQAGEQAGLSQAETLRSAIAFETRLAVEAPKVYERHPFLDENSQEFDENRAAFINQMYLQTVGYDQRTGAVANNGLSYTDFVDGFLDAVGAQVQAEVAESQQRVAQQAAQTGPRPGGATKKVYQGDDPSQMTDEQLDQLIAQDLTRLKVR